jgi:hypothetical protein
MEEINFVRQFTLGTCGQMFDELDFITINSDFGWLFFYFLGCKRYHDLISLEKTILDSFPQRKSFYAIFEVIS